jgi:hypothetical protein
MAPMRRTAVLVVALLAACGSKKSDSAGGSGSAAAGPDPAVEQFIAGMKEYGDKMLPMMLSFTGDCGAIADQMLTLEPLAQSLRKMGGEIEADPARSVAMKARMRDAKGPMMEHYDQLLKPLGATMADVEKKEAEIKAKCAGDAKYHDAEDRVGIMKKKSKPAPTP